MALAWSATYQSAANSPVLTNHKESPTPRPFLPLLLVLSLHIQSGESGIKGEESLKRFKASSRIEPTYIWLLEILPNWSNLLKEDSLKSKISLKYPQRILEGSLKIPIKQRGGQSVRRGFNPDKNPSCFSLESLGSHKKNPYCRVNSFTKESLKLQSSEISYISLKELKESLYPPQVNKKERNKINNNNKIFQFHIKKNPFKRIFIESPIKS